MGSHLLVIAIGTGISTFGLLSLARQYFVNADRQSLLVQARLLAQSCDQTCLDKRLSNADISRARALLDFSPHVGFEDGLRRTVQWLSANSSFQR